MFLGDCRLISWIRQLISSLEHLETAFVDGILSEIVQFSRTIYLISRRHTKKKKKIASHEVEKKKWRVLLKKWDPTTSSQKTDLMAAPFLQRF